MAVPTQSQTGDGFELGLLCVGMLLLLLLPHAVSGDGVTRFEALRTLLEKHQLSNMAYSLAGPFFSTPLYYLGKLIFDPSWWIARYNTFLFIGGVLALDVLLRDRVDRRLLRTFLLLLVAASMFPNHVRGYYGEMFTAVLATVGIVALACGSMFAGWIAIVLGVVNTPAALVGLSFVALKVTWDTKHLRHLLPVAAAVVLILLESWVRRGGPFVTGYEANGSIPTVLPYSGRPGFSYPFAFGLLAITLSFGKGLLFFAPGLLLLIDRHDRALPQVIRHSYTLLLLFLAGMVVVYAKWWAWYGGWSWGPRFFLIASVPASLATAVSLHRAPHLRLRMLLAVLAVLALSVWVSISGGVFDQNGLEACLQHDYAQEFMCWYVPEFSVLWHPFTAPALMPSLRTPFVPFCVIAFLWLAAPLVERIVAGGREALAGRSDAIRRLRF